MLRLSNLGFLALSGSILIFIFQTIASLINKDFVWKKLRLVDILDTKYFSWVDGVTLFNFNTFSNYILNMPLYAVLFCLTILFFVFSGIFERP